MLLNSLDILTFVVPPILPAALTANNAFAQKRLEKEGIYCLHSKHISLCGGIDICAFDKVRNVSNCFIENSKFLADDIVCEKYKKCYCKVDSIAHYLFT